MKRITAKGFTLVELLIVIALLGVIATIVIAAINPIEQANRASDAGMKADASQIVSALQRYYASHSEYPWNTTSCSETDSTNCRNGSTEGPDSEFGFVSADDAAVGICGASGEGCKTSTNKGELIAAEELQNTFINKSWVGENSADGRLWVGKADGSSSSVFVCWVPKAKSNRQVLLSSVGTTTNKLLSTLSGFTDAGIPAAGSCTAVSGTGSEGWSTAGCVECVPE